MITGRTKIQLVIFLVITLAGVSFTGAKYARIDRMLWDTSYAVTGHFAESGGIFTGAEVTYRGVTVGRVGGMELTDDGVDVILDIENDHDEIPADTRLLVGNRSAVGEQYVELQPQSNGEPYLESGSEVEQSQTETPIHTTEWLRTTTELVNSVPKKDLNTVITEFGAAFKGSGPDLARLIDSSTSFIEAANQNFELTRTLVDESRVVLGTQLDKASAIRSFSRDLRLFSDTMVEADGSLRKVIDDGSVTARTLRTFLEENQVDLGKLINNLVTLGEIQIRHLDGLELVLVVYPYVVAGGYTVADDTQSPNGKINAHFGMILTEEPPSCDRGYNARVRDPQRERGNAPMDEDARCAEPPGQSNPRGAQNTPGGDSPSPGRAPFLAGQAGVDAPVIGSYDRDSGSFTWGGDAAASVDYTGGASEAFGDHSWKWLLLQPVMQ
jgi:phospholipid/cholesterol/gamma-HCH transport system substrate-binding protein